MNLMVVGISHRTAPMALRERLAIGPSALPRVLDVLASRFGWETVILSTCNRVEVYLGRPVAEIIPDQELIGEFLSEATGVPLEEFRRRLYCHRGVEALRHLFVVASGLDSLVLGEGQIAGQVRDAYETACEAGTVGPLLHALFQHARRVVRRVHTETELTAGKISVSSLAVDYLRQVFEHFHDKTVLIIGAGKMGELTLRHLAALTPKRILVTNRNAERAKEVADQCGGTAFPFDDLDRALAKADIILSTTGAPEPIISLERFQPIAAGRSDHPVAIIDLAVPRDFDPRIADLDAVDLLINVDDLQSVRDQVLRERERHVPAAEAIVAAECDRFRKDWSRRQIGPTIAKLHRDWDAIREEVQRQCLAKLNGKLSPEDQAHIAGAFRLLQNKLLYRPVSVLRDQAEREDSAGLLEAIYKLFRLHD